MQYDNNTTRIRRDLLVKLVQLFHEGKLVEKVDRLPVEMRPRHFQGQRLRCCIHSERAILKYRIMALLGHNVEDETDELKPLSEYAREALARDRQEPHLLSVIEEACSACVKARYFVTNACQGCVAQPCLLNCPKKAIRIEKGQSKIDPETCVNCGRCKDLCPFHAILRVPVPCEEACPVGAITRSEESGKQILDNDQCIFCGKCMQACPFGAVVEQSQLIEVLRALAGPRPAVALFAPALAGQFNATLGKVSGALRALGFDHVMEVAAGADRTTEAEAEEFLERREAGAPFMTTSCCPAYTTLTKRHLPELRPFVSSTPTPLHFTAELAAERFPGATRIFISPCVAKRHEVVGEPLVDHVLTFEELGAAFARGIDVPECAEAPLDAEGSGAGRGFAASAGVRNAVAGRLQGRTEIQPELISGIDRDAVRQLKQYAAGKGSGTFLECMSCEGGCINGPCAVADPRLARRRVETLAKGTPEGKT